jgi:type IV pilus assembly protein PilW
MTRPGRSQRGFTLVELLVSMTIAAVVCAGALALLSSQQRAFRSSASDRALQETARTGLSEIATNLRRVGYGIEPWLAIDLGSIANAPPSWPGGAPINVNGYPSGAPGTAPPGCGAASAVPDRDSVAGPDEIVFHSRDPSFSRGLAAAPATNALTFDTALTSPMYRGQILQVMCGAASAWAYVTVKDFADQGATQVQLQAACTTGFPYEQNLLTTGCFAAGYLNARVFKIDRFHYYIGRYLDTALNVQRPYLMLDRGLWTDDGVAQVEPVAPDVEDIQFAYVFPRSPAAQQLVGATSGTQLSNSLSSIDFASAPPAYTDNSTAVSRTTNNPANIRGVRVSIVARARSPDLGLTATEFKTIPAAGNRPAVTNGDPGYRRLVVETTEAVRNLDSRGPFFPAYSTNGGADHLNVGGG